MIARIWHGVTPVSKGEEYFEYVKRTGFKDYSATEGNHGALILRRTEGDRMHFLTISLWDSLDAIRKFAGEDLEKARYYPEDKEFLLDFEPNVLHYEVFGEASVRPPNRATI